MIDTQSEHLIPLNQVAEHIPSSRPGKKLNVGTVWRWASAGVRSVKLETVSIGNSRYTSREALERFIARCSGAEALHQPTPTQRTDAQRKRDHLRAEKELDDIGVK